MSSVKNLIFSFARGGQSSHSLSPPPTTMMSSSVNAGAHHHPHTPGLREVTEDIPVDHLEGTMKLTVVLPSKKTLRMTVNRRTPMMDLLIQVTTANKINPGDHIVQVKNERGIELAYKPSSPIGLLDTTTIEIVPKSLVNNYIIVKQQQQHLHKTTNMTTQPFEHTFRLQVHLPRNQLYVMRVGPKTLLQDILEEVCQEKNLDISKYEIRHPINLDEKLLLSNRLGDYGLQQLRVISKNSRINCSVSTADIMALQQQTDEANGRTKLDSSFKYSRSSVGESSVSSESAASARGTSPSRSDDSRSISPLPPVINSGNKYKPNTSSSVISNSSGSSGSNLTLNKLGTNMSGKPKKRAAPLPPPQSPVTTPITEKVPPPVPHKPLSHSLSSTEVKPSPRKKDPPKGPPVLAKQNSMTAIHYRDSSDSSGGYHETSVSDRHERPTSLALKMGSMSSLTSPGNPSAGSTSNLTSVSSLSTTSLTSSNGGFRHKRKAPKPPTLLPLQSPSEVEEVDVQPETPTEAPNNTKQQKGRASPVSSSSSDEKDEAHNSSRNSSMEEVKVDVHTNHDNALNNNGSDDEETEKENNTMSGSSSKTDTLTSVSSRMSSCSPTLTNTGTSLETSSPSPVDSINGSSCNPSGSTSPSSRPPSSSNNQVSSPSATFTSKFPLPQPRIKPRETNITPSTPNNSNTNQLQLPQPKPRPRPDRKDKDIPKIKEEASKVQETKLRNPMSMSRIGIKVLPDNALKDGMARFSRASSLDKEPESNARLHVVKQTRSISPERLPTKMLSQRTSMLAVSTPPVGSKTSASSSNSSIRPKSMPSQSIKTTKSNDSKQKYPTASQHDDSGEDSDNLEENMDLFERKKRESIIALEAALNIISSSSSSDSSDIDEDKQKPIIKRIESDSNVLKSKVVTSPDYDDGASSDRPTQRDDSVCPELKKISPPKPLRPISVEHNSSLNRWKNTESLNQVELLEKNMRLRNKDIKTSSNKHSTNKINYAKKIQGDVKKETEDQEHLSETEGSLADSGLPALDTPSGPSPVSTEHLDNSPQFSRRSSLDDDLHDKESWREILQAKVDSQQNAENVIESAFDGEVQNDKNHNHELNKEISTLQQKNSDEKQVKESSKSDILIQSKVSRRRSLSGSSSSSRSSNKSGHDDDNKNSSSALLKTISMQDLGVQESKMKTDENSKRATSVLDIHGIAPDIASNPKLMETFQTELENQFEQWKEEFLQKHLTNQKENAQKAENIEKQEEKHTTPSSDATERPEVEEDPGDLETIIASIHKDKKPPGSISSQSSSSISIRVGSDDEIDEEFDPEKPQIIHSVGEKEHIPEYKEPEQTVEIKQDDVDKEDKVEQHLEKGESTDSETDSVVRRNKKMSPPPPIYRYSGPPSINMGTWGERPKKTISVKNDEDYIMGMGQADLKTSGVGPKQHSYTGLPPVAPAFVNIITSSSPEPRPISSSSTLPKVLTSWKQKVAESESQRKEDRLKPVAESTSSTSTFERPTKSPTSKPSFSIQSASSTLERPVRKAAVSPMFNSNKQEDTVDHAKPALHNSNTTKVHIELNSLSSSSSSGFSSLESTKGPTMEEKRRYFQGIKPSDSPTREAPLPGVNMRNSIEKISKVFEHRQHLQKSSSNASLNNSILPSRETSASPAPSHTSSDSHSTSSSPYPTLSKSSTPELIGGKMASDLMVQHVIKAQSSFNSEAFRRTPSPAFSNASSSTGRSASPITNTVTISTSSNPSIKNIGNKAIIVVGGESNNNNNEKFKHQLKVNGTESEPNNNPSMIIVNKEISSQSINRPKTGSIVASMRQSFSKPVIVEETVKSKPAKSSTVSSAVVPPPPPPMQFQDPAPTRPSNLFNGLSKSKSVSNMKSQQNGNSSPKTPTSPDPRSDLLNAIKSAGGISGLKKTRSTSSFLLN